MEFQKEIWKNVILKNSADEKNPSMQRVNP